jgi:Fic family protein
VVVFQEIHPFEDGNGRLSRILTTLLMLQFGYGYVPYSSLESIIEQNKGGYYIALRQLSAELLALAREHGRLTTAQAKQHTGAKRATIKAHLAKLVKDGHLAQHGVGRGTWYVVPGR